MLRLAGGRKAEDAREKKGRRVGEDATERYANLRQQDDVAGVASYRAVAMVNEVANRNACLNHACPQPEHPNVPTCT